jgi:hypothetical protein
MGRTARVRQRCRATEHISSAATVTWGCERHGGHRVDGSSLCVSRLSGRIRIFGREAVAGARVGCRLMERRRRARRQRRSQAASHGTVTSCAEEAAGMGAGASIGKESGDGYLDRARRSSFFFLRGRRWGEQVNLGHLIDVYVRSRFNFRAKFSLL